MILIQNVELDPRLDKYWYHIDNFQRQIIIYYNLY